jgi:parvulin-like peptidyl-prolyl isomerase
MIVQKLISDEVQANVKITPEDVERFYKAETDRFKEPASAEVRVAKADTEDGAKAIKDFPDKPVTVIKGGNVPGASEKVAVPDALFTADADAIVGPVQAEKSWYVFKVISKKEERTPSFEEIKDRASRMFQMQKEQEKVSSIIDETLKSRDVHLYPERLKEPTPAK